VKAETSDDGVCGFPHPNPPPQVRERERSSASVDTHAGDPLLLCVGLFSIFWLGASPWARETLNQLRSVDHQLGIGQIAEARRLRALEILAAAGFGIKAE